MTTVEAASSASSFADRLRPADSITQLWFISLEAPSADDRLVGVTDAATLADVDGVREDLADDLASTRRRGLSGRRLG
jgi:hypothetical protein